MDLNFSKGQIVFVATIYFMAGLWGMDVSAAAMNMQDGRLVGLFGFANPAFAYHFALLLAIGSFTAVCAMLLRTEKKGDL